MRFKSNDSCLAKVADDEPIFVLRAQDKSAPDLIRQWAASNHATLADGRFQEAHRIADAMDAWQRETGRGKWPD
jgi:hypothetical protein